MLTTSSGNKLDSSLDDDAIVLLVLEEKVD
jgi:hypothetical protein